MNVRRRGLSSRKEARRNYTLIACVPLYRYYADIRQTISASDQEMNSALAELSRVNKIIYFRSHPGPSPVRLIES